MRLIVCLAFLFVVTSVPAGEPIRIGDVRWLEGCWDGESSNRWMEECWSDPAGGMMVGYGRTMTPAGRVSFEYLRLVEGEGGVTYLAQPGGRSTTRFAAVFIGEGLARFTNPQHDYPRVIEYRREGDQLTASIGDGDTIETSTTVNHFHFVLRDD